MADDLQNINIQNYVELDLSNEGVIAQNLMQLVDSEASEQQLTVSNEAEEGALAAGITPSMMGWLQGFINSARSGAVSEAEELAKHVQIGKGRAVGVLEKREGDKLKQHRVSRRNDINSGFRDRNTQLISDCEEYEGEYEQMKFEEGGRDAKVPSHFLEWGVLLPLVMIPEAMLNFESFRRTSIIQSDAQALGVTVIVGVGIAIAAHLIGRYFKQINFFMQPDENHKNRNGWTLWTIGSTLLFVALAVVGYARYNYLLPQINEALLLGQEPPNIFMQTGGMLLGNLVVFLIGAALTFLLHDQNPDFSDKKRKLDKLQAKRQEAQKKEVDSELAKIDAAYKSQSEKLKKQVQAMANAPNYAEVRRAVAKIEAKDAEVLGLLSLYKQELVSKLPNDFFFTQHHAQGDRAIGGEKVSKADFKAMPISILWS